MIIGKSTLKSNGGKGKINGMVISLLGPSGVKCQVADFSVLVNPPSNKKGSLVLETGGEITDDDRGPAEGRVDGPGEYEVAGVRVRGIHLPRESSGNKVKTAYAVNFDSIRLAFLDVLESALEQTELDKLGEVDILFVDTEGSKLNTKEMVSLIKKIDPNTVIPLSGKGAKKMLEEFGQKGKAEEKLTIKPKEISKEEGLKVVWLKDK